MKLNLMRWLVGVLVFKVVPLGLAAPISPRQAQTAAQEFIARRYPAPVAAARSFGTVGPSALAVRDVEALAEAGRTLGFVSNLSPAGYVLLRADDEVPAIKLYSDHGSFTNLPPGFLAVMKVELAEELDALSAAGSSTAAATAAGRADWAVLLGSATGNVTDPGLDDSAGGVLTQTTWNQCAPYNLYSPTVADALAGFGGRTTNGCVAVAMAQILRYHQKPARVVQNYSYTDSLGTCTGVHSMSEAGLGDYDWGNMPLNLTSSSPPRNSRRWLN
jgi:hypothetical protein